MIKTPSKVKVEQGVQFEVMPHAIRRVCFAGKKAYLSFKFIILQDIVRKNGQRRCWSCVAAPFAHLARELVLVV